MPIQIVCYNSALKDNKGQSMTEEINYEMAENIDYSERDLEWININYSKRDLCVI